MSVSVTMKRLSPKCSWTSGARCACGVDIDDGGQLIELQLDLLAEVFSLGACRRDAHRDGLADHADLVCSEGRIVGELESGQAARRAHRLHAGGRQIPGGEDAALQRRRIANRSN